MYHIFEIEPLMGRTGWRVKFFQNGAIMGGGVFQGEKDDSLDLQKAREVSEEWLFRASVSTNGGSK